MEKEGRVNGINFLKSDLIAHKKIKMVLIQYQLKTIKNKFYERRSAE